MLYTSKWYVWHIRARTCESILSPLSEPLQKRASSSLGAETKHNVCTIHMVCAVTTRKESKEWTNQLHNTPGQGEGEACACVERVI